MTNSESEDDLFDSESLLEDQISNEVSSFNITVISPERRINENTGGLRDDIYTAYQVESTNSSAPPTYRVWRRYNQFLTLRLYLEAYHPSCIIPPMPLKNTGDFWNKLTQNNLFDADFIATRQIGLERFLQRCIAQPKLASDRFLFEFLTLENGWDKKVEATEYAKKSETWLKQVSAKFKVNNKKVADMKYYIEELADHLKAVLKSRQRIKDRVFRCKQLASNYAKVFGELSQIEVSVNDEISALKNAYVEAAGEIETHVRSFNRYNERETALSHDLVEYIQYCDAISDLIKRYEIVQYQQEKNEAKRADLEKEKYEIESGGGKAFSLKGVTRAIMGSGEQQKLQRLAELEVRIKDLDMGVKSAQSETATFIQSVNQQLEQFEWMKNREIAKIIRSYSQLETEFNQEAAESWRKVDHSFKKPVLRRSSSSTPSPTSDTIVGGGGPRSTVVVQDDDPL